MKKFMGVTLLLILFSATLFSYEYIMNTNSLSMWASGNTQITTLTSGSWDSGYYDLSLPADNQFYFYGKKVTHVRIWTNGYVTFGFGSAPTDYSDNTNDSTPNSDNPNAYAAPWWDDWDLTSAGSIWYSVVTLGPTSNNWVTIEWRGVPHKSDATASYTFQVVLLGRYAVSYQPYAANCILFNYSDTDSGTGTYDHGTSGTVGIEHYTGWQAEKVSYQTSYVSNNQSILFTPYVPIYDTTDFWGVGKPDTVVFRPDEGTWYKRKNDGTSFIAFHWGTSGDVPLPGDFDADGDADECVLRPSNYGWYGQVPAFVTQWGTDGDIPVVADFNGDGRSDLAVFRPRDGVWYINYTAAGTAVIAWGTTGDIPVAADYDNDGQADCAVYRPSTGVWYIRKSSNPASPWVIPWGTDGDIPFPTNIASNTYSTICVYRPSNGVWYSQNQTSGATSSRAWGTIGDLPIPNDWNGGGLSDETVWRPSDGTWYIDYGGGTLIPWGYRADKPRCRRAFTIVSPNYSGDKDNK